MNVYFNSFQNTKYWLFNKIFFGVGFVLYIVLTGFWNTLAELPAGLGTQKEERTDHSFALNTAVV